MTKTRLKNILRAQRRRSSKYAWWFSLFEIGHGDISTSPLPRVAGSTLTFTFLIKSVNCSVFLSNLAAKQYFHEESRTYPVFLLTSTLLLSGDEIVSPFYDSPFNFTVNVKLQVSFSPHGLAITNEHKISFDFFTRPKESVSLEPSNLIGSASGLTRSVPVAKKLYPRKGPLVVIRIFKIGKNSTGTLWLWQLCWTDLDARKWRNAKRF